MKNQKRRCGPCLITLLLVLHFTIGMTCGAALWYLRDSWKETSQLNTDNNLQTAVLQNSRLDDVEWFALHDSNTILSMKSGELSSIYDHNQGSCVIKVESDHLHRSCLILPTIAETNFTRYMMEGGAADMEKEGLEESDLERTDVHVVQIKPTNHELFFSGLHLQLVKQMCGGGKIYRGFPLTDEWFTNEQYIVEIRNITTDVTTPHPSSPESVKTTTVFSEQTTPPADPTTDKTELTKNEEFRVHLSHWTRINFRPMSHSQQ